MPSIEQIITDILKREGPPTNDPADPGGRTMYGISEKSNPEAWKDGHVSEAEARLIYERKYIDYPGFNKITDQQLKTQLIDFGVVSGQMVAIQKLQEILSVEVDGVLGPQTLAALTKMHPEDVNNLLVAARVKMICKLVQKNPALVRFLLGWTTRALDWLK